MITLEKDKVLLKTDSLCAPVSNIDVLSSENPEVKAQSKIVEAGRQIEEKAVRVEYIPEEIQNYEGKITWQQVIDNPNLLDNFIGQLSIDELCTLNVNRGPEWGLGQSGVAGTTGELKEYGLKSVRVSDANAGWNIIKPNIGFPCSSTIAATFNKDIAYTVGRVIAEEGKELEIAMNLGPGMNLERATLNGRNAEYFSEDPYLAGIMAGYHGKGLEENGVTSCYKHMFCNNAELCRKASHSIVPERALRELYFKAFEVAFRVHKPSTVMTSYNALNGIYPAENVQLLQGLLRDEWGFDGFIMTDWDSYDTIDVVEIVKAGTSWVSSGGPKYVEILKNAVDDGKLSKAVLQNNVKYLLKVLIKVYRNQMKRN